MYQYINPVKIHFDVEFRTVLENLKQTALKDKKILLVTSNGFKKRGIVGEVERIFGESLIVLDSIAPNPELAFLQEMKADLKGGFDCVIALGGGSVMDSAKFLALQNEVVAENGSLKIIESLNDSSLGRGHSVLSDKSAISAPCSLQRTSSASQSQALKNTLFSSQSLECQEANVSNTRNLENNDHSLRVPSISLAKTESKQDFGNSKICDEKAGLRRFECGDKTLESIAQTKNKLPALSRKAELHKALPIFAFPTTAGTGSELTQWATIWDKNANIKYSLMSECLYPQAAFYDVALFSSAPRDVVVSCALDSLSHACESIWNKNANPISTSHGLQAISLITKNLPLLCENLQSKVLWQDIIQASIFASLAFSNTQTALAHAISYPITMSFGVPHGLACSFSLPLCLECITDERADSTLVPYKDSIKELFAHLQVSTNARDYGLDSNFIESIFSALNERAKNGLLDVEKVKSNLLMQCKNK